MSLSVIELSSPRRYGPNAVVVGLVVLFSFGTVSALLSARLLTSAEYTVFTAFSGLLGILLLSPASALEQESAVRTGGIRNPRVMRSIVVRAALIWSTVAVLLLVPAGGWQQRLLGEHSWAAVSSLVVGTPLVLWLAVMRGHALARADYWVVARAHMLVGVGLLVVPFCLHGAGVPWTESFVLGTVLAWLPAAALVHGSRRSGEVDRDRDVEGPTSDSNGWLLGCNLLLLTNLLAVPPLLRWHVADLGADVVADVQILTSLSRLPTSALVGFLPFLASCMAATQPSRRRRTASRAAGTAMGLGLLSVLVAATFGGPLIGLLTGRTYELSLQHTVLATAPTVLLCPTIFLTATAIALGKHRLAAQAWGLGLLVLSGTACLNISHDVRGVLVGVLLSAAAPALVLVGGLSAGTRRLRSGPPTITHPTADEPMARQLTCSG